MRLKELEEKLAAVGVKVAGREQADDGGWIIYFGKPSATVYPFAFDHCIPIKVPNKENPELYPEQSEAVMRRFFGMKKPARKHS